MLAIVLLQALGFAQVSQVSFTVLWDRLVLLRCDSLVRLWVIQRADVARRVCTTDYRPSYAWISCTNVGVVQRLTDGHSACSSPVSIT